MDRLPPECFMHTIAESPYQNKYHDQFKNIVQFGENVFAMYNTLYSIN